MFCKKQKKLWRHLKDYKKIFKAFTEHKVISLVFRVLAQDTCAIIKIIVKENI